jgi:hypothetical protein
MYKNLLIFLKFWSNFYYCKFQKTYNLEIVALKITLWLCFSLMAQSTIGVPPQEHQGLIPKDSNSSFS